MGLGTRGGGLGVARYLANAGAIVTVTDNRPAEALAEPLAALAGLPIRYVLGGHDERDFVATDLVVRNPGVRRDAPLLRLARAHDVQIEMEMSLFLRACPAQVIGVTGSKGKTTVATLAAAMVAAWNPRTVLAGNMGISALDRLPEISADTPVVLELSSWQLEATIEHGLSPHVAVITNIAEDHLNTYRDFAEYAAVKRGIGAHQHPSNWLVLNRDDPETWRAAGDARGSVVPCGLGDRGGDGAWLAGERIHWRNGDDAFDLARPENPALVGAHNAANLLAAVAAARLCGAPMEAISAGLAGFAGVPHRMERVAIVAGVRYINDTAATAPVAAAAALRTLAGGPVRLIAGGADKGLDPGPLVAAAAETRPAVFLLGGTATPVLHAALRAVGIEPRGPFDSLVEAVAAAAAGAQPGDSVLLSPGCASFGLFRDEFDRGERFRAEVRTLAAESGEST
ncbi:MAG: UDP-N-acetylmuramoyl-L-alanine--D-glutamate ligase [Thermomicrobiales bacterium]|nr:UDP-N-acetylmuramoyl-L-alanine--D-glutamate ligase [Thermomicrobiales bacterium]